MSLESKPKSKNTRNIPKLSFERDFSHDCRFHISCSFFLNAVCLHACMDGCTVRYGMVGYGTVRSAKVQYGRVRYGAVRHGTVMDMGMG